MIYEPESVDIHTVMIAAQKAEISLSFANPSGTRRSGPTGN